MAKTLEQLEKMYANPFYNMSDSELNELYAARAFEGTDEGKKKDSSLMQTKGNALVKEKGQLDKHPSDPV